MHIDGNAVRIVAAETRKSFESFDRAILDTARLSVTLLEANGVSAVPAGQAQLALRAIHESTGHLISARSGMVRLVSQLTSIKRRSDQAPMNVGCPGETPLSGALQFSEVDVETAID